ncbi:protein of unknown function [Burkholderia multivorans]
MIAMPCGSVSVVVMSVISLVVNAISVMRERPAAMRASRARTGARAVRVPAWRSRGGEEGEQVGHAGAGAVGRRAELLGRRAGAVEPERRVAEPAGARHVPSVRRDEHDVARRGAERIGAERICGRARLVCAHRVDRQHAVEQAVHPGALDRDVEHLRIAVRQDRELRPRLSRAQLAQRGLRVGVARQARVLVHQPLLGGAVEREAERTGGKAQRVERDVPEWPVAAAGGVGQRAKLRILELLAPPQLRQPFAVAGEHLLRRGHNRMHVEQRAVCVEEDGSRGKCRGGRHRVALHGQRSMTILLVIAISKKVSKHHLIFYFYIPNLGRFLST